MIRVVIDDTKVQTPVRLMILIRLNDVMNLLQGALTPMILDVHKNTLAICVSDTSSRNPLDVLDIMYLTPKKHQHCLEMQVQTRILTHLNLASFLWDTSKQTV